MGLDDAIVSRLASDPAIGPLVKDSRSTRIFVSLIPEGTDLSLCSITYEMLPGTDRLNTHDGYSGLGKFHFRIRCWGPTHAIAENLANLVRVAIHDQGWTIGTDVIQVAFVDDEFHEYYAGIDTDKPRFSSTMMVHIWFEEAS
jgi:hypothetical protein